MRRLGIGIAVLFLLVTGCGSVPGPAARVSPSPTEVILSPSPRQPSPTPTTTPEPTIAPTATPTVAPPATPTPTAPPTPTPGGPPASLAGAEWTRLPTNQPVVALTFDAGGNDAGVAGVLRALSDAGVPATFFLTGRWTEVYPGQASRIAGSYTIGNHTYSHPDLTELDDAAVAGQVTHAASVIDSATGRDPHPLFRFPYGATDSRTLGIVHGLGYGGIRWTVDTLGWEGASAGQSTASVLNRVLANLRPGEIVLMHVGGANDGTTLDADALPSVIREVQARGYRLVAVSDFV
jgi:peptidoglycan/xylan/chitin deacetylase (PgdA/CDA1 family)